MSVHRICSALFGVVCGTVIAGCIFGDWSAAIEGGLIGGAIWFIGTLLSDRPATQGGEAP